MGFCMLDHLFSFPPDGTEFESTTCVVCIEGDNHGQRRPPMAPACMVSLLFCATSPRLRLVVAPPGTLKTFTVFHLLFSPSGYLLYDSHTHGQKEVALAVIALG